MVGVLDLGGREGQGVLGVKRGASGCGDRLAGAWWCGSKAANSAGAVNGADGGTNPKPLI